MNFINNQIEIGICQVIIFVQSEKESKRILLHHE